MDYIEKDALHVYINKLCNNYYIEHSRCFHTWLSVYINKHVTKVYNGYASLTDKIIYIQKKKRNGKTVVALICIEIFNCFYSTFFSSLALATMWLYNGTCDW